MNETNEKHNRVKLPFWAGAAIVFLCAAAVFLLGVLAMTIIERRWEAQRPSLVLQPIAQWEPDSAVWGQNYPRQYESYLKTSMSESKTKYGGSDPRDYLEIDPRQVILFAGYGFSKEYLQARGHAQALTDVTKTARLIRPFNAGTCLTCKSAEVPQMMEQMGTAEFYAANFHDLREAVSHPIGCQDCHDPKTMRLRITRPALREAFEAMGKDIAEASHQEMRSLVCAQCHVEYYFQSEPKNYLKFPWDEGMTPEAMIAYYDEIGHTDYTHAISGTPIIKAQHPDYELYSTGIHAYRDVSCADCHMPYRTEGGQKFTDHHVQSPLLNIANSCAVCHRWEEAQIRQRVESIQDKVQQAMLDAEEALVKAHFDVAAAAEAGASDGELAEARQLLRHAQFRWDYISANNGMGFHSAQESMRVLGDSANQAQQARLLTARILAREGITSEVEYPDISDFDKAQAVVGRYTGEELELPER